MGRNSTHNTRYEYLCTLAAITVSSVTYKKYYMQSNFCLGRCTSYTYYHIQLAGPCPRAGSAPLDPALASQMYGATSILNNPDAQTQELNPASDFSPHAATLI